MPRVVTGNEKTYEKFKKELATLKLYNLRNCLRFKSKVIWILFLTFYTMFVIPENAELSVYRESIRLRLRNMDTRFLGYDTPWIILKQFLKSF